MLDRDAKLAQIASKLFDAVVVSLDCVSGELLQATRQSLGLGDLSRPNARPLLVKHVLNFDREDLAVLIEVLGTCSLNI